MVRFYNREIDLDLIVKDQEVDGQGIDIMLE